VVEADERLGAGDKEAVRSSSLGQSLTPAERDLASNDFDNVVVLFATLKLWRDRH
jgi:hypothetical protein